MKLMTTTTKTTEARRSIPCSVIQGGYVKMPEWLFYYLAPNSLNIMRVVFRTLKTVGSYRYSDLTNRQLSERCGLSVTHVDRLVQKLEAKGYMKRRTRYEAPEIKRRKIYFSRLNMLMHRKTKGRSFREMLAKRAFKDCKRIEWARVNTSEWLQWIPAPNRITDPYCLKVYGVLIGQHLRGKHEIALSCRQIALICQMDRGKVSECICALEAQRILTVETTSKRRRIIRFVDLEMAGLCA